MIHTAIQKAYGVLDGEFISKELCCELGELQGEDILDLASLANKVKNKFSADRHICTIVNAKSGVCGEDCKFCSQSLHYETEVEQYPLLQMNVLLKKADDTYKSGVRSFGIVTSGTGYKEINQEFETILDTMDEIYKRYPDMYVCASTGFLSEETAIALAKHKTVHYNINLQTNPDKYRELVSTTHDISERIETIKLLKKHNVGVCSGGIIGLGETMEDRIEMAFKLKELNVDVIPLNVLIPVEGTPVTSVEEVSVADIVKTFAIFRLVHPGKVIKFAAGRETKMKDFQGLIMLSGANGYLTGGYLTTRGRDMEQDQKFERELLKF